MESMQTDSIICGDVTHRLQADILSQLTRQLLYVSEYSTHDISFKYSIYWAEKILLLLPIVPLCRSDDACYNVSISETAQNYASMRLKLNFSHVDIEPDEDCAYDSMTVYDRIGETINFVQKSDKIVRQHF